MKTNGKIHYFENRKNIHKSINHKQFPHQSVQALNRHSNFLIIFLFMFMFRSPCFLLLNPIYNLLKLNKMCICTEIQFPWTKDLPVSTTISKRLGKVGVRFSISNSFLSFIRQCSTVSFVFVSFFIFHK